MPEYYDIKKLKNIKKLKICVSSMKDALETFDLGKFKKWLKIHNPGLYGSFVKSDETVQMATMCKMICNRTDMLGTDAHRKAVQWLSEHNMSGRMF